MDRNITLRERIIREFNVIFFVFKKEYKLWQRYPARVFFMLFMPFLSILTLYFQGKALVGGTYSEAFENFAGTQNYLAFIIIGSALFIFVSSALWGIGNSIRREQVMGTLESMWVSPASKFTIFFGVALFDGLFSTYVAFMQILMSSLILPINLLVPKIIVAFGLTFLLTFSLYGIGFLFTGIVLMFKEVEDFMNLINSTIKMVSPVSYPLSVLPAPIAFIALFIPLTYALQGIRGYLGLSLSKSIGYYTGMLLIFDVVLIVLGSLIFGYAEKTARRRGEIATH
ncbi:MAG: ABC transporter permease [Candidatus Methanofastidiosia archaeon]